MNWFKKTNKAEIFSQWVSDYHPALYRHAFWLSGHREIASDMVQEAFFQAWRSMGSLRNKEQPLPWLLTILRRAVFHEQRLQYRHAETVVILQQLEENLSHSDEYPLLDIYNTLDNITPKLRDIFLLHQLHGFSYEEISRQLEIPVGTVMSRLSRAREALKQQRHTEQHKVIKLRDVKRGNSRGT